MASEFFTILTAAGRAKIAAALAEQKQIVLQTMVVGDGNGKYVEPSESQTKVEHEVWRGQLNTLKIAPENPAWVIAEAVLPEAVGGWYIREVGLLDKDGVLIAIGKFPETYKPKLPAGASKQIVIRAVMEVTNAAAVTLMVDPSLVMATVEYVDLSIEEHEKSHNHPDATLTQKGFTQLNSSTDSTLETQAATPKAVKAAMDKANEALEKAGADKAHKHAWGDITGVPDGTLTQKGVVKLNNATNSTSTTEAATPSAVKAAYDLANGKAAGSHKHPWGDITGVPDGTTAQKGVVKLNSAMNSTSTTEAATPSAVKAAYDKASAAAPANHTHYQFFTANGTFTVPNGVTQVFVEMLGGGGGGGGGGHASNTDGLLYCSGGNAGKGGEPEIAIVPVITGNNYPVTVGAGGASGAGGVLPNSNPAGNAVQVGQAGNSGINGGNSIFIDVVANGGAGGAGGIVQSRIPLSGFDRPDSISGGNAETTSFGKGGTGAVLSNGSNASGYGAGGGGGASVNSLNIALSGYAGGRGSGGFVKISW
ncbi:phage tail protein [Salmonella enterica subsp. enterica serovar Llandoff]|nr:phage tail protein [Salmonella enterica subsp. enterica serovar Llandoff]